MSTVIIDSADHQSIRSAAVSDRQYATSRLCSSATDRLRSVPAAGPSWPALLAPSRPGTCAGPCTLTAARINNRLNRIISTINPRADWDADNPLLNRQPRQYCLQTLIGQAVLSVFSRPY